MWGDGWDKPRDDVRQKTAGFLNCSPNEIAFTHNTTETFNLLAQGLSIGSGDEVLFSNLNHAGASICFEKFATQRGYTVKTFDIPLLKTPNISKADILNLYEQHITPKTKLLVLPHIDNTVGIRHPLKEITDLARSKGVEYIAVDAAQTVGMIPVDVQQAGIDVLATSAHKWLQAPKGIGLAYISQRIQDELQPMWVTWGQNQESWKGTARIYEDYGTRNLPELLTLGSALDFHQQIVWNKREQHLKKMWSTAQKMADKSSATGWASPRDWELSGSLYAIEIKNMKSGEFFQNMFDKHGFVFRPFENMGLNTVRISPNLMNTEEELNRFFEVADKI
jgi:selenocysteine lyase/cysteine desulfurase